MKTNVIIKRQLGAFEVEQQIKDGFFDASKLLEQWNKVALNKKRQMDRFLESPKTKEFIDVLNAEESQKAKMLCGDYQCVTVVKGRTTSKGRTPNKVMMHPYLFIDFAMWLNPKFKYDVIKFVYDQLVDFRHKAGDNYKSLTASVATFKSANYPQLAKGLNWIVFGRHEKNIRNNATEQQMNDLHLLEEKLSFAIDMGYIKSFEQLIQEMRKLFNQRNVKF